MQFVNKLSTITTKMEKVNTSFGDYLKGIRNKRKETLADVSGAVEIDVMMLDRIESCEFYKVTIQILNLFNL